MSKTIVSGNDLMLFDSTGKSIGYATSHTLTISSSTTETTSKDHGFYAGNKVNNISWEISSENLYTTEEYDALFTAMMARQSVTIYFGLKTIPTDETKTVVNDDYNAWSIAPTANVADSTTEAVGSYSSTGSVSTATHGYFGKAFITNLTANANVGENATFSVTLTGDGKIAKVANQ